MKFLNKCKSFKVPPEHYSIVYRSEGLVMKKVWLITSLWNVVTYNYCIEVILDGHCSKRKKQKGKEIKISRSCKPWHTHAHRRTTHTNTHPPTHTHKWPQKYLLQELRRPLKTLSWLLISFLNHMFLVKIRIRLPSLSICDVQKAALKFLIFY